MQALGVGRDVLGSPAEVAAAVRELGVGAAEANPALAVASTAGRHVDDPAPLLVGPPLATRPALDPDRTGGAAPPPPAPDPADEQPPGTERRWLRRALAAVAVALGIGVFLLGLDLLAANRVPELDEAGPGGGDASSASGAQSEGTAGEQPSSGEGGVPTVLPVTSARDYDPFGNGSENSARTALAVDGDTGTLWPTQTYYDPLELQKPGVGLLLDLGETVDVSSVDLSLAGSTSDVEVLTTPPDARGVPPTPDGFDEFASAEQAPEQVTLSGDPTRTRFVLVWLTRLPPVADGWRGGVAEVVVRG